MTSHVIIVFFVIVLIALIVQSKPFIEPFIDQTIIPKPRPDALSWDFRSPKSSIKNFNETTELHQNLNRLNAQNSHLVDNYQPLPEWVYPYTFVNRRFDYILMTLAHKMEKDFNQNLRLNDRDNREWRHPYKYQEAKWDIIDSRIKNYILDIIHEINRRFNMNEPIVEFRREKIKYYWIDQGQLIIILNVYKKYTIDDIKYFDAIDPNINEHSKFNFERELLIYLDEIDQSGGYHLKYLRFPAIEYENDDSLDDITYVKELDNMFYIARSKHPMYRMLTNPEARDLYIAKITKDIEATKYKCFPQTLKTQMHDTSKQINDQTICELANGLWEKQCAKDTDCPYFKSNKNYTNDFGGCDLKTGYCQMPLGVDPLTHRKPANPKDAYCYNCDSGFLGKGSIGQCCPQQLNGPMKSPDYMFVDDVGQRYQNRQMIENNHLNWSKYL